MPKLDSTKVMAPDKRYSPKKLFNNGLLKFDLKNNDQIILSDLDEIPDVETLKKKLPVNWVYSLEQDFYYYNLHNKLKKKWNFLRF